MKRILLLCSVIAAAMMELIDTSIVNVALADMSGNLGATLQDTSWVITSYAIANVIIIPLTSFLAAKLGRRNYYIGSIIAFTFFSFLCGTATNIWALVAYRFLQGIGGGALLSVSMAIVFELFSPEKKNVASAVFGLGIFVGPTFGPTLGGYFTEYYSWPWVFYINIPIGIVTGILCYLLLEESKHRQAVVKVDWIGIILLALGVSSLQTVLERGEMEDWFAARFIVYLTITALIGVSLFIWWELKIENPAVNLRILKSRNLAIASTLTFISGIGIYSSILLTPLFAQRILNFPPMDTGLLLLPGALVAILGLILSARLLQRGVSPVYMIAGGMALFIWFSWQMSFISNASGPANLSTPLIWRALGLAMITVPLTTLAVSALAPAQIPQGSALNNMMRQLGGSFGIALINTYLTNRHAVHRYDLLANYRTDNPLLTNRLEGYANYFQSKGSDVVDGINKSASLLNHAVEQQASILSYIDAYLLVGIVFLLSLPLLLLSRQRKRTV
jgi:MFS transporter, DHA2 family, multidrug resistance protein